MPKSKAPVIACVKWGDHYGAYYVNALYDMAHRHLNSDFAFECFTDDAAGLHPGVTPRALPGDLTGWWNKLHLFRKGVFEAGSRVIYFDLDTLIIGGIEALLNYTGNFALLRDFYRAEGYGSGVMLWRAGACDSIWSRFEEAGRPLPAGGDQAWIETAYTGADRLQDCFPGMFVSFKTDCNPLPPAGARVVCFHGEPKQDNCGAAWVRELWRPGGALPNKEAPSAGRKTALANYPAVKPVPAHDRQAVIVGGGSTLDECRDELQNETGQGHTVFAVGGALLWLEKNNFGFDAHVMNSAHAELVPQQDVPCYYASTCPASVLEKAGKRLQLWHPAASGAAPSLEGESTGLCALSLAHLLGYRRFHLYGFDSCIREGAHHAYGWPDEERNRRFTVELYGRRFQASMWMLRQADAFVALADRLLEEGCSFSIHGDGMLHFLASEAQRNLKASSSRTGS